MMKQNKLRYLLDNNLPSTSTRMWSTWPFYYEIMGDSGNWDYVEFVAEYSPFTGYDLENICRACELYNMASMIKVDFFNRFYVMQKAIAAGFQGVMLADHRTPDQVRESIRAITPETLEDKGLFGYPNRRYIGAQSHIGQVEHAQRLKDIVVSVMIEKASMVDSIEEVCSIPGVDMIQFGPSDFCMSLSWNRAEHAKDIQDAQRKCIEVALKHGVQPRCEINTPEEAQWFIDLGVKHFSYGDQLRKLRELWEGDGKVIRAIADSCIEKK